ncbi:MAG: DUF2490 domain-containing protein [Bacteroidota bacterium]
MISFQARSEHWFFQNLRINKRILQSILLPVSLIMILATEVKAQTTTYNQISGEYQFTRTVNHKWALELWLGSAFSSTSENKRILATNIQRYFFVWGHYFASPRWKLSSSIAYYCNKDVPDIGQYLSPEWRLTLQGTYFFHKIHYTLSTRMRGEVRYIMNAQGVFDFKYRYRQMLKFMIPINHQVLRKGVFYFVTTEELMFKPDAKTTGVTFFDPTGLSWVADTFITDDIQLELTYVNEFLPRDEKNEMYNVLSFTATFNNLLTNLKKGNKAGSNKEEQGD